MKKIESHVAWVGREEVCLMLEVQDSGAVSQARLTGVGGPYFLRELKSLREQLKQSTSLTLEKLPLPTGTGPEHLILREVILKAQGRWQPPYAQEELCHCRAVLTTTVDQAICSGAHTPRQVSEQTSASTACGTCRPDVEAMISWRLLHFDKNKT